MLRLRHACTGRARLIIARMQPAHDPRRRRPSCTRPASWSAPLVAPPDRRRGRTASPRSRPLVVRAAVPGGHHLGLLVPAQRGIRARAGIGQARRRDRAAADPPAPDREPGAAGAHRARDRQRATSTPTSSSARPTGFTRERPEITQPDAGSTTDARITASLLLGAELPRRDDGSTRRARRRRCRSRAGAASPSSPSPPRATCASRSIRSPFARRLRHAGVPGAHAADRPQRLRRHADRRVLGRGPAALLHAGARSRAAHAIAVLDAHEDGAGRAPMHADARRSSCHAPVDRRYEVPLSPAGNGLCCAARAIAPRSALISNGCSGWSARCRR